MTHDDLQKDIALIRNLQTNGFPSAAHNLAIDCFKSYSVHAKNKNVYELGVHYLSAMVLQKTPGKLPAWCEHELAWQEHKISWQEWLAYFPDTSVEALEDTTGGRSRSFTLEQLSKFTPDDFKAEKTGLFYSPNGFHEQPQAGKVRRRTKGNLKRLNAFFVDIDGAATPEQKAEVVKTIKSMSITPSFVVETKNGFHVIWRLNGLEQNEGTGRWVGIQKTIVGHYKSDRACIDESRLLRMPWSWHCKDLWTGGQGYLVKLVFKSDMVYSMDDFKRFEPREEVRTFTLSNQRSVGELKAPEKMVLPTGQRHAGLKEEAAKVYARLGTDSAKAKDARQLVKDWYQQSCSVLKVGWEKEVDAYCDWLEQEQFGKVCG